MSGAGFIIYKKSNDGIKYLTLEKFRKDRYGNKFDIPKGIIDEGETPFEAACRELQEEANIKGNEISLRLDDSYKAVMINPDGVNTMSLYLAEYVGNNINNVKVMPNPSSKKYEHLGVSWMNEKDAEENCLQYLKTIFRKAENIINEQ